jgi:hypothetical protein
VNRRGQGRAATGGAGMNEKENENEWTRTQGKALGAKRGVNPRRQRRPGTPQNPCLYIPHGIKASLCVRGVSAGCFATEAVSGRNAQVPKTTCTPSDPSHSAPRPGRLTGGAPEEPGRAVYHYPASGIKRGPTHG